MTRNQWDAEDAAVSGAFILSAAVSVGIADVTLFNYAMSDALFSLQGTSVTLATLVSLGALGIVYVTNEPDLSKLDDEYKYAAIGTVAIVLAIPLVPSVESFVTSNDFYALGALAVQAVGYAAFAYLG